MTLRTVCLVSLLLGCNALARNAYGQAAEEETVRTATNVIEEIMRIPARKIPGSLLSKAQAVAIIPNVVKGGFVVGVRHGKGVILIRDAQGVWQPPMFVTLTGGSIGWQVGIQSTDLILVFRTERSVNGLLNGKLTIGADASAAAGPVGRKAAASTDAALSAEILSYSKSRGLFAGVSIDGSVMQIDQRAGAVFYRAQPALPGTAVGSTLPASAFELVNTIARYTGAPRVVPEGGQAPMEALPAPQPGPRLAPPEGTSGNQLMGAEQQLQAILNDGTWKSYLQIPMDPAGGPTRDMAKLREALQRYDAVASDQRYAPLSQRPEFARAHQMLRGYMATQAQQTARQPQLPPPPATNPANPARR
jgi:lipid-binding SYLF domain-containing protein